MHCPAEDTRMRLSQARLVTDRSVRDAAAAVFLAERSWSDPPPGFDDQEVFEFLIERALLTRTTGHGDPDPRHEVWSET
jgi:hypothetical protein